MRQPDARAFLFDIFDIQTACQLIREFTSGMMIEAFGWDPEVEGY